MTHGQIWHEIGFSSGLEVWVLHSSESNRSPGESWQDDANPIAIGLAPRIVL